MTFTPEQLADLEQIKMLKARYFRFTDTKQWDNLREVFTEDATIIGGRVYDGREEFIADRPRLQAATTTHHGHMPEITFLSPTKARGVWAMYDRVEYPDPTPQQSYRDDNGEPLVTRGFVGTGHYEEEYRKDDGVWRISLLRLTRLRLVAITSDPAMPLDLHTASNGTPWLAGE
jgi:hypothetical protein